MIGELLVKEGLITPNQLNEALELQKKQTLYAPLGEICINQGYISKDDLRAVLNKYKSSIPLGKLLINMKLISNDQLQQALTEQKRNRKRLGQILIDMGAISDNALTDALSVQLGIPKIIPALGIIDRRLLKKFNPEFLQKHQFIPAFQEGNDLTVIMADPLDERHITLLRKALKTNIILAIAPVYEIQKTIAHYSQKLQIGQELDALDTSRDLVIGDQELFKNNGDDIIDALNFLVSSAIIERATDIHIEPQNRFLRIRYRIDGVLHHKTDLPISMAPKLASRIKAICGLDIAERRRHQDGRIQARIMKREFDLRISTFAAIWGENIVIRVQSRRSSLIDINKIGFSPANLEKYLKMLEHPTGIILITGPTGSGKTTTLYASVQYLNNHDRVIMTVEDPVEYTIDGVVQASIAPKLGVNYTSCLRSMMRQDPDVLMIGEIRDPEAAEAVVQASLTGHKVFSTFHTDDTTGALLRLMDMGIETFLISSTVVSVVAQRLVRILCEHCKEVHVPDPKVFSFFRSIQPRNGELEKYKFFKAKGCIHCNHSGYKGMTSIHEVMMVNAAIRDEILQRSTSTKIRAVARKQASLVTMPEDGFYKALKGFTTFEEVMRVVYRDDCDGLTPISVAELVERCEKA
ncbi:MAG TPA: ATPase, T2SS/T4P/T4SS family [bacterium]